MTKHELLEYLARVRAADADDVAGAFDVPYSTAAMAMLRLVRQGLARRHLDPDRGTYWYQIADEGRARLLYFENLAAEE